MTVPVPDDHRVSGVLIILLLMFYTSVCETDALQSSFPFTPSTELAAVTLRCVAKDEVLDIVSVGYKYNSIDCSLNCTYLSDGLSYLNDHNIECRNEENIRVTCYARSSCTIAKITQPFIACGPENSLPTSVSVYYRCISSGHANRSTPSAIDIWRRKLKTKDNVIIGLAVCCGCLVVLSLTLAVLYRRKCAEKTTPKANEPRETEPSSYEMLTTRTEPEYSQLAVRDTQYDDIPVDHTYVNM